MVLSVRPVQVTPSGLVAMLFVPSPTATQSPFAYVTPRASVEKIIVLRLAHEIPLVLVAMLYPVLEPTATHSAPLTPPPFFLATWLPS